MNFFKRLSHKHTDITDIGYTYCSTCGSPFSSLAEAQYIMKRKHETRRLNELLSKRKLPRGLKYADGHIPPGLTDEEEVEFQILRTNHFDRNFYK